MSSIFRGVSWSKVGIIVGVLLGTSDGPIDKDGELLG